MTPEEMIRVWKDPEGRAGDYADHPAGEITVALEHVGGNVDGSVANCSNYDWTLGCCWTQPLICPFTVIL